MKYLGEEWLEMKWKTKGMPGVEGLYLPEFQVYPIGGGKPMRDVRRMVHILRRSSGLSYTGRFES